MHVIYKSVLFLVKIPFYIIGMMILLSLLISGLIHVFYGIDEIYVSIFHPETKNHSILDVELNGVGSDRYVRITDYVVHNTIYYNITIDKNKVTSVVCILYSGMKDNHFNENNGKFSVIALLDVSDDSYSEKDLLEIINKFSPDNEDVAAEGIIHSFYNETGYKAVEHFKEGNIHLSENVIVLEIGKKPDIPHGIFSVIFGLVFSGFAFYFLFLRRKKQK